MFQSKTPKELEAILEGLKSFINDSPLGRAVAPLTDWELTSYIKEILAEKRNAAIRDRLVDRKPEELEIMLDLIKAPTMRHTERESPLRGEVVTDLKESLQEAIKASKGELEAIARAVETGMEVAPPAKSVPKGRKNKQ